MTALPNVQKIPILEAHTSLTAASRQNKEGLRQHGSPQ